MKGGRGDNKGGKDGKEVKDPLSLFPSPHHWPRAAKIMRKKGVGKVPSKISDIGKKGGEQQMSLSQPRTVSTTTTLSRQHLTVLSDAAAITLQCTAPAPHRFHLQHDSF